MALVDLGRARAAGLLQFGKTVLYQPKEPGSLAYDLTGVWTAPFEMLDLGAPSEVSAIAPKLGVDVADLPAHDDPKERIGDRFTRQGVVWRVIDVEEDGEGGAELIVHRA